MDSPELADAQLTVTVPAGAILAGPLYLFAIRARTQPRLYPYDPPAVGELLAFTYRDPYDPEEPDAPRPLRRGRLVVVDDGPVPDGAATLEAHQREGDSHA